jgi:hypothetical protein
VFSRLSLRPALVAVALGILAGLVQPSSADAYEEGGHFYTVAVALSGLNPQPPLTSDQLRVVEFCSYLPDESEEFNAVTTYYAMPWSGVFGWWNWDSTDPQVRRMVMVQQQLHALTGSNSIATTQLAEHLVRKVAGQLTGTTGGPNPNQLCELGFALHYYGDSVAHRKLSDGNTLYETGWGHGWNFAYPDYPLFDTDPVKYKRADNWNKANKSLLSTLFPGTAIPNNIAMKFDQLATQVTSARDKALQKEIDLRQQICEQYETELGFHATTCDGIPNTDIFLPASQGQIVFSVNLKAENCDDYVKHAWNAYNSAGAPPELKLDPHLMPNCAETWRLYHQALWSDLDQPHLRSEFLNVVPAEVRNLTPAQLQNLEDANLWQP